MSISAIIKGVGHYTPPTCLTNQALSERLDTSDEWIQTRTGISQRRIAGPEEPTSFLAIQAGKAALENAGVPAKAVDLLILATMSPDKPCPATACSVAEGLGLKGVGAFDLSAACSGFVYALEVGSQMVRSGAYRHILVIGAEKLSSLVDWEDRSTCVLFGDGAGAVVLSASAQPSSGVLGSVLGSEGSQESLLHIPAGGCLEPASAESVLKGHHSLKMNGREIFKNAVRIMEGAVLQVLTQCSLKLEEVRWVFPHQANLRIIESLAERLRVPLERFPLNLQHYGNTSAASIPLSLSQAHQRGQIQPGDLLLMVGFGAGFTWGASLVRWV